jgi:hypothetical protein
MPRAPGPLPPWAREIVAALRFLGQHLARLRHQLGRQLAKVARRGPKKALGAPPRENVSAPEAPPELLPLKLEAEPAEALFTSFDLLLLAGALAVVAFVAWQSYKRRPEAVVRSVTPPLTPEDKGPTEPRTLPSRFRAVLRGAQSPEFASPQSFEERRSRQPPARRRSRSRPPKPGSPRGAPGTAASPQKPTRPAPLREARTAFVYFGLEQLDKMRAEHPDWSLRKIGETCQRRWDVLGEEAKAPYVELAQTDAKRYKAEAAAYLAKM